MAKVGCLLQIALSSGTKLKCSRCLERPSMLVRVEAVAIRRNLGLQLPDESPPGRLCPYTAQTPTMPILLKSLRMPITFRCSSPDLWAYTANSTAWLHACLSPLSVLCRSRGDWSTIYPREFRQAIQDAMAAEGVPLRLYQNMPLPGQKRSFKIGKAMVMVSPGACLRLVPMQPRAVMRFGLPQYLACSRRYSGVRPGIWRPYTFLSR